MNAKLGELVEVPPVVPIVYVLVISAAAVNPPVPVHVKPVKIVMSRQTVAAVANTNIILLEPKVILRVLVLVELNIPVVKLNPFKFNVPEVKVVVVVVGEASVG